MTDTNQQLDPSIVALTKAIGQSESSGNYTAQGKSGEHGAYQYTKPTWEADSQKYLGQVVPLEQATPAQQDQVAYSKVQDLGKQGYNPAQIASIWNSGKPQWEGNVGVNKYGVKYDTPAYVQSVGKAYQAELKGQNVQADPNNPSSVPSDKPQPDANGYITSAKLDTPTTQPPSTASATDSLGQQMANRANYAAQGLSDAASGKINPLSGLLHVAGAAGGAIGDVTGDVLGAITPDFIKKPVMNAVSGAVNAVANTGLGKAAIGAGQNFAQSNPELAADAADLGNIAMAVPIFKGAGAVKGAVGTGIAKALGKDALSSTIDAISPEIKAGTKAGAANVGQRGTTKSFLLGKISRVEDPILRETAPIIQENIPNFDKMKTFSEKLNAIQDDAIPKEAKALRDALTKEEIQPILHQGSYEKFVNDIEEQIKNSPALIGNNGEYARRFLKIFNDKLPVGRDITMVDILDARQALDRAAKSFKPKVFDGASENAYHSGLDAVRSAANTLLDENAPNAGVKASLRRQSLLYKAAKNLSSKADKEVGTTRFGRFTGKHPIVTGLIKGGAKTIGYGLGGGAAIEGVNALRN